MKHFLLIDDHAIVRSGVRQVLEAYFQPCEIHEAVNETAARNELFGTAMDIIIMDVNMPETDTVSLMNYIHGTYPGCGTLIFSMSAEKLYAKKFLTAGAMGFISKEAGMEELKKAIQTVMSNRKYISKSFAEQLADESTSRYVNNPFEKLSKRELEIAKLLVHGHSIKKISGILNISPSTAGTFKTRLSEKLNVKNIVELIELTKVYIL